MSSHNNDDDKPVGYGRPPKKHQFKPGTSGNPKGRPRQASSLRSELMTALGKMVTVKIGNNSRRVTMRRAIAERLVNKAAMGDTRSILTLEQLAHAEEQVKAAAQRQTKRFTLDISSGRNPFKSDLPDDEGDDD